MQEEGRLRRRTVEKEEMKEGRKRNKRLEKELEGKGGEQRWEKS